MRPNPFSLVILGCLAPLVCQSDSAAQEKERSRSFQVNVLSDVTMEIQGQGAQKITADVVLRYSYRHLNREATLIFDSMKVKAKQGGSTIMDVEMDKNKMKTVTGDKVEEVAVNDAPADVRQKLQGSFGVPICKFQLDATGKELKRTVVAGPGAKDLIHNGQIANAQLFHAPFVPGKDRWQAEKEVSMGNGGYARGTLTYEPMKKAPGLTTVKVSGTLSNESFKVPGNPLTLKAARYVVRGEQTFNSTKGDWETGNLVLDVSFKLDVNGQEIGTAKGTMQVQMKALP